MNFMRKLNRGNFYFKNRFFKSFQILWLIGVVTNTKFQFNISKMWPASPKNTVTWIVNNTIDVSGLIMRSFFYIPISIYIGLLYFIYWYEIYSVTGLHCGFKLLKWFSHIMPLCFIWPSRHNFRDTELKFCIFS